MVTAVPADTKFRSQFDIESLRPRLSRLFEGTTQKHVAVACSIEEESQFAFEGDDWTPDGASGYRFRAGCLTKVFTAMLLEKAIAEGKIAQDELVASFFHGLEVRELARVTVRHCLDHTHGLDDSQCAYVQRGKEGFIDRRALVASCGTFRLSEPGEIYSYSNIGCWIAGSVLEQIYDRPFEVLLQSELFGPLGLSFTRVIGVPRLIEKGVCPSTGGVLEVSVSDVLALVKSALDRKGFWPSERKLAHITPVPGWSPFERGVYRCWKYHGGDWFGHNAITKEGATALVRINPAQSVAIVVASKCHQSSMIAAKIFGKTLPEYRDLRIPKSLPPEARDGATLRSYEGVYGNAAETISIRLDRGGQLVLQTRDFPHELTPAESRVLFWKQTKHAPAGFVQLLQREECGYRYLWDGRKIYLNECYRSRNELG